MKKISCLQWIRRYWLLWLPAVLLILTICFYPQLLAAEQFAARNLISCPFYELTGLYCPGCGGTRSLTALLHGKFLLSLHENPTTPLLLLFLILVYCERVAKLFGKRLKLFPRSAVFWNTMLGILLIWSVLRNFIPVLMPFPSGN